MAQLATVFGGSGFIGSQIVRALARDGWRIRVAVRRPERAYRLRPMGDVGQIEIVQANLRDRDSAARALDGSQAAVNAVGVLFESGRQRFSPIHVEGAATIAREARAAGTRSLVHLSAIGADASSPSRYARTKAEGESAVRAAFAAASILRPSVVFGPEDDFFNRFAGLAAIAPALPLIGGGATRFQPVFVGDVAEAAARLLANPRDEGRTFELGGPRIYSFRDLMVLVLAETGRRRILIPIPVPVAKALGSAGDLLAAFGLTPPITTDQVKLLGRDNVVAENVLGLSDLGLAPTAVEGIIPTYLWRYRKGGQYSTTNPAAAEVGF
ncbi:MAG: complex I NDUFA9 subunit family protein [Caulobacteraceae bacterium]